MPLCVVAAADADVRERVARSVDPAFDRITEVDLVDLPATVVRERPDLVVVAADTASGVARPAWTVAVAAARDALPGLSMLVAGPVDIARDAEHRLAATALDLGARGFLRSGEEVGPRPFAAGRRSPSAELSRRELDVLLGMTEGLSNSEIATALTLAEDTVKTHARRLFRKLGAGDRADAVARGFRQGILR